MRNINKIATTFAIVLALSPSRAWGQKEPVTREIGAMVATAPVELATEPVSVRITLRSDARAQIEAATAPTSKTTLLLTVEGINYDKIPDVSYQVYVNLPKDQHPNYKSVYFVGNLALFLPMPHPGMTEHATVAGFDITRTVRQLKAFRLWNEAELSATFVMSWLVDRDGRQLPVPPGVRMRFSNIRILAVTPP